MIDAIRRLGPDDAAAAVAVIHGAFAVQSARTDPPSAALRETADSVRTAIAEGGGAGFVAAGELVAIVLWAERDGGLYCGRLAVLPAFRRRGIARALIGAAEDEAGRQNLPRVHLSTRLALLDNRRLFAACGFREVAFGTHDGCTAPTSVMMEKRLATERCAEPDRPTSA